jgi:ketosteroid isomerase-like protein
MSDQAWMISLEVVSHVAMQNYDLPIIDRRRQEWVAFSNSHLVNDLVTDLYANDALYFDQANIHIGRAEIITAYQYMSDPGFSINLTGLSSCQLQDDLAFELGEYSSNGTVGMYTIIWEKTHDGRWHIALDSNT